MRAREQGFQSIEAAAVDPSSPAPVEAPSALAPPRAGKLAAMARSNTGRQFRRYSVVGLLGFVIDMGVYTALTRGFPFWRAYYLGANAISFTCAVISNFTWHKLWTFRPHSEPPSAPARGDGERRPRNLGKQFGVFVVVSLIGLALNSLILRTVSQHPMVQAITGTHSDLVAKAIAVPIVWLWNFGANKLWTFRRG